MTTEEVIRLLKIEHACSQADCDRRCNKCEIVQEQSTLDEMYTKAIQLIEENAELKAKIKRMRTHENCKYKNESVTAFPIGKHPCSNCSDFSNWELA